MSRNFCPTAKKTEIFMFFRLQNPHFFCLFRAISLSVFQKIQALHMKAFPIGTASLTLPQNITNGPAENRVSLNVTLFGNRDTIHLSAIASGGSQALFFKLNTFGEEAFLDKLREIL